MSTKKYAVHPAAEVLPLLPDGELRKLAADIRRRGLIHPILLYQGLILDGRNRANACKLTGVKPCFECVDEKLDQAGVTPLEYVVSLNLRRRQMTASQAAMAAAGAMPEWIAEGRRNSRRNLKRGKKQSESSKMGYRGRSDKLVAKLFGVSSSYISEALALKRRHPDLAKSVFDGTFTLSRAMRISRERSLQAEQEKEKKSLKKAGCKIEIFQGDIVDLAKDWRRGRVDLIATDPPYASDALPLWEALGSFATKALRPGGFLAALAGLQFLPQTINALSQGDLQYFWTICVRFVGPNGRRHGLGIVSAWRPCIIFYRPPFARPARQVLDHIAANLPLEKTHVWEQKPDLFANIIKNFTKPSDQVLDPFAGSGSVLIAARSLGRNAMGFDVDQKAVAAIAKRLDV